MKTSWLKRVPMAAVAAFLASSVLHWVPPEPLQNLQMAERVASFGLFLLLLWLWLAKGLGKLSNAKPAWVGWLGLLGLSLLLAPGMLWVILAEDSATQMPPHWLNVVSFSGYPLALVWACYRLKWAWGMMQKARIDLAEQMNKKD